jgi:hypothetical protein
MLPDHNTRETIANDLGWSTGKVAMTDMVLKQSKIRFKYYIIAAHLNP